MSPEEPQLIGNKCGSCGHYFFPRVTYCRNPFCDKKKPLEKAVFSRKGKLMAYTVNHYPPPLPFHQPEPFVPFGFVSVELPEGIRVGGQVPQDVDTNALKVGFSVNSGKLGNSSALVYKR
jgi:uncharacterized OB-fold protein